MLIHDRNFRKRVARRMAETGETWEDAVRQIKLGDPDAKMFQSFDPRDLGIRKKADNGAV